MSRALLRATKALVALATLGSLVVYVGTLNHLGLEWARFGLFALLGGIGVVGAWGVVAERPYVAAAGACGLLAVGVTQPVLWMVLVPQGILLVVAALVVARGAATGTGVAGDETPA